jgi:hypothetical protein
MTISVLILAAPGVHARHGGVPQKRTAVVTPRMLFQSFYSKADNAFDNKDLDGGLEYHDPDFVEVQRNGDETDLGEVRFRISSWIDLSKAVHSSTSVVSASVQGINGTVMVKSNMSMIMTNPDTRARAYFIDKVVTKDTWAHRDDGWMLLRSQIISEMATNNGHKVYDRNNPFAPAPPPADDDGIAPGAVPDTPQPAAPGSDGGSG